MADPHPIAGSYTGRQKIREGMESAVAAAERNKILKSSEEILLNLDAEGGFVYRRATAGRYEFDGRLLRLYPTSFNGMTLEVMKMAAEEAGREFGLGWIFNPIELVVERDALVADNQGSVIFTEFRRSNMPS